MAASLACLQARIDTFSAPAASKARRTSSKTKKAPSRSKNAWPLAAPSAHDLAFAGFVWKPTTASPDNVQCFSCHCQLDGWEDNDVPAYEHLTHSPSCGFAVVTCIRLRTGDPGRSEDDPGCEAMTQARRDTFGEAWPLDSNEGFPSIEQVGFCSLHCDPAAMLTRRAASRSWLVLRPDPGHARWRDLRILLPLPGRLGRRRRPNGRAPTTCP